MTLLTGGGTQPMRQKKAPQKAETAKNSTKPIYFTIPQYFTHQNSTSGGNMRTSPCKLPHFFGISSVFLRYFFGE
jgi:hypothetical protein